MDNKTIVKIVKPILAGVGFAISTILAYFKGRKDGHKKGVKDGKAECNEELEEIIRKNSNQ